MTSTTQVNHANPIALNHKVVQLAVTSGRTGFRQV